MKKVILLCLVLIWQFSLSAVSAELSAVPSRPVAGESFMLQLTVDSVEPFQIRLPQLTGLKIAREFTSTSTRQSVVNGKVSTAVTYGIAAMAEKSGELLIPPFTLDFDGEKVTTAPLTLVVRDPGKVPAGEKLHASLMISPARQLYSGETVRASVEISVPAEMVLQGISGVEITGFGDTVFVNKERGFVQSSPVYRRHGGSAVELSALIQLQKSGEFRPECRITVRTGRRGDSFFFSPPPVEKVITALSAETLTVKPLPPPPANAVDTKLFGSWEITAQISKNRVAAGELAEITVDFRGNSPAPEFKAPAITLPGCRVYPPELTAVNGGYTVKYPVVPLESGEKRWQFPFASFDPEKGTYQVASPEISCTVTPGNTAVSTPVSGEPEVSGNMPPENSKTIPFELMPPADRISLPLADNIFYPAAAAILIILISAVKLLIPAKKPAPLKSALRKLAAEIAASDDWQELLRGENCAVIAEALKLPPGSTCAEIAGKIDDPEIREIFLELDRRRFSPGEAGGASGGSERRKLLEFIGRLSLSVLLFALPLTGNAADFDTAMQYFANGDYPASAGIFRAAADEDGSVDPAMLYNTGCAEYMQGNYPAAWLAFTRASLLEPLNDDYARAVEKTTARLPDMPQFTNRFLLTPCGYALLFLFAGAAIIFPAAFIPACRRKFMLWAWLPAVIAIFAAVMAVKLHHGAYSPANAVVVRHDAQLSALPVGSGGSRTALPVGSTLLITGESGDFYQVRCGGTGGWVRKHDAERVFPYELF